MVLKAVGEALGTLKALNAVGTHPLDLLLNHIYPRWECYLKAGHEPANDLSPRGVLLRAEKLAPPSDQSPRWNVTTDAETLDLWLKTQLQPVLKALSEDKVAARVLTTMLPEPWMYETDPEFYLRGTSKDILDERQRIMEQRQRVFDASGGGNVGAKPEGVASAEREAEERKCTAEVEWEGAFLGFPAVEVVTSRVEKEAWCETGPWCFRGHPAVWLWTIWRFWPVLMRGQAIPPVPAWPHADECSSQSGDRFRVALIANVGHRLKSLPGEAANGFMWALADLREKLEAGVGTESDEQPPAAHPAKGKPGDAHQATAAAKGNIEAVKTIPAPAVPPVCPTPATDPAGAAARLRAVAEALREWGKLGGAESAETRAAARKALNLAIDSLHLIEDARRSYGCSQFVTTSNVFEDLSHAASVRHTQDLGAYWCWWPKMTQRTTPQGPSFPDQLDRWANELERAASVLGRDPSSAAAHPATGEPRGGEMRAESKVAPDALKRLHELHGAWQRLYETVRAGPSFTTAHEVAAIRALDLHAANLGLLNQCRQQYGMAPDVRDVFSRIEEWATLGPASKAESWDYFASYMEWPAVHEGRSSDRHSWGEQLEHWIGRCAGEAGGAGAGANKEEAATTTTEAPCKPGKEAQADPEAQDAPKPPAGKRLRRRPPRLDEERQRVYDGERWYDVTPEQLGMLSSLFKAKGGWIAGRLLGRRPDKLLKAMPPAVRRMVEPHQVNGYRIPNLLPK